MTKPTTTTTTTPSTTTNSTTTTPQPSKRRRRTKPPPKTLTPPTTTEIDHWFQSGPFSALPAGATPAEVDADIKRIRALIAKYASVLLGAAVNLPVCSAQQEQDSEEASAFFERGMSLSPPPPLGRELSPGSATSSSLAGFAAEPLTPESFYGEEPADIGGGSKGKEKRQRQRQKKKQQQQQQQQQQPAVVSPAPAGGGRKRSPAMAVKNPGEFRKEVYKSYTGPAGRLKRLRAKSPHV